MIRSLKKFIQNYSTGCNRIKQRLNNSNNVSLSSLNISKRSFLS